MCVESFSGRAALLAYFQFNTLPLFQWSPWSHYKSSDPFTKYAEKSLIQNDTREEDFQQQQIFKTHICQYLEEAAHTETIKHVTVRSSWLSHRTFPPFSPPGCSQRPGSPLSRGSGWGRIVDRWCNSLPRRSEDNKRRFMFSQVLCEVGDSFLSLKCCVA